MGSRVLEEHVDEDYEPTTKEVEEYAEWLGMDLDTDSEFLWIARKGLKMPLPHPWRPCQVDHGDIFYFNFLTGESVWEHPLDEQIRRLYQLERKKKLGKDLTKEEEDFLIANGHDTTPRPCKVATLFASVDDSGVVEVSAMSMGGNVFATAQLKSPNDPLKTLRRRLNKAAGDEMKLVLPDGTLPGKADRKRPVRELLGLPVPETPQKEQKDIKEESDDSKQAPATHKVHELAPLKVRNRFQQLEAQKNATDPIIQSDVARRYYSQRHGTSA